MQKRGIVRMLCLQCGKDSPQSRLRGGAGRIRTVGTALKGAKADVCVSYRESITLARESIDAMCYPTDQTSAVSGPIVRRIASDSVAEMGHFGGPLRAKLVSA